MDGTGALSLIAVGFVVVGLIWFYGYVLNQPFTVGMLLIALLGFLLSYMDTAIGMGYGTVGTPLLIILGYSSKIAVPAVLVSQAVAALFGVVHHHRYRNVDIPNLKGNDAKIAERLVFFGIIGTVIAALIAIQLTKVYLNTYIGLLVIAMGALLLLKPKMKFSWMKVNVLSFVSGFNKAISGGGYGPVATTGLLVSGNPLKNTVGTTLFSVVAINISAFAIYLLSHSVTSFMLPVFLTVGAAVGSQLGPRLTKSMKGEGSKSAFAVLAIVLGIMTIVSTFIK